MGRARRESIVKDGRDAHPTRLDNLFLGNPLAKEKQPLTAIYLKIAVTPFLCEAALNFLDFLFVSFFVSFAAFGVRSSWRMFIQNWYNLY